ncbi:MAG: formylmethanofuran dehydrogenase [Synergistaceae bacterium]|nr:formylmethanofuran dehydrogenase [Synergistaceae bacterium]
MSYLFISGRTTDQAKGMHIGKLDEFYMRAVSMIEMNAEDMERENLNDGEAVTISSEWGEASGWVKKSDVTPGMVFTPMGPVANAITSPDTEGTGMPLFKGFTVEIKKAGRPEDGEVTDERRE